jgi:hypothetical protein
VSTISIMIRCGIMWISGAAQGELLPTLTSVMANCARVLATHRSQAWAIIQPPAKATPLTAAIVGLLSSMLSPGTGNMSRGGTVSLKLRHLLQIAAGAEGLLARARQDRDAQRRVALEAIPRGKQSRANVLAQGVARLRADSR